MSTHNICFHGEEKYYFSVEKKKKKMPCLELYILIKLLKKPGRLDRMWVCTVQH